MKSSLIAIFCAALVGTVSCGRSAPPVAAAEVPIPDPAVRADGTIRPGYAVRPQAGNSEVFILSAGSSLPVRLTGTLDTRTNRRGDSFTASLDEPLTSGDRVVVPKGTLFTGHITDAGNSGRLKGHAVIALTLDSFALDGRVYHVNSTSAAQVSKGHKKRNWLWIGGTTGGGAAIGGAAAGGSGALIGAGAGAAAGTVGAVFSGKQHVQLPSEARITFKLAAPLEIDR